MKSLFNLTCLVTILGLLLLSVGTASATAVYMFDPNDLIDEYASGTPTDSVNPRAVRSYVGDEYTGYPGINSWNTAGTDSPEDLAVKADFLNWRDNDGGYISEFNIWIGDMSAAKGWGETLVIAPGGSLSATAATGWTAEVSANTWVDDTLWASWSTTDSNYFLSAGGPDIGDFSFSADLYVDANSNGWDTTDALAVIGVDYTIWFGGYVGNNNYAPNDEAILFQSTLEIAPVPEPATMVLFGLGILGLAGVSRKKQK